MTSSPIPISRGELLRSLTQGNYPKLHPVATLRNSTKRKCRFVSKKKSLSLLSVLTKTASFKYIFEKKYY